LETKLKRTQNEPNFECQMHRLNPNSELSREAQVRAGGLCLERVKRTEAIRSRKPGASREEYKTNTNEASMLLKTRGAFAKRTQFKVPRAGTNAEFRSCEDRREETPHPARYARHPPRFSMVRSDCHSSTLNSRLLDLNSAEQSENVYENKGAVRKMGGLFTYVVGNTQLII
jgi:hypothetical protein